jgi:WD40 repeat protein
MTDHMSFYVAAPSQQCAITETSSGTVAFRVNNGFNRFSGLVWDSLADQLLLIDCVGVLTKWSAFSKQTVGKSHLEGIAQQGGDNTHPLVSTSTWMHSQCKCLVVAIPKRSMFQQYDVVRESKRSEFTGHADMVVGCFSLLASSTNANEIYDYNAERVMVSASADNTIRVWDSIGRHERYQLQEPSTSEIACIVFAPNLRLFVTGNQDGSLRWYGACT